MGRSREWRSVYSNQLLWSFECTRGHGFARGISQVYVLDWAWIYRWRRKVRSRGKWRPYMLFPIGTYSLSFTMVVCVIPCCDCLHDAGGSIGQGVGSFVGSVLSFPRDVGDSGCLSVFRGNLGVFSLFHSAWSFLQDWWFWYIERRVSK